MGETTSTSEFSGDYGRASECYRHPGRETNVSCSSCGRPICPDCMTPSPVGMRCPECGKERTKVIQARSAGTRSAWQEMPVTSVLIALNVLVFVVDMLSRTSDGQGLTRGVTSRIRFEGSIAAEFVANGEWYRIFSSAFIHSDFFHIAMNMLVLFILGRMLEGTLGSTRFAALYFASLTGGALGVIVFGPSGLTAGASGAGFGLMGASAALVYARRLSFMDTGVGPLLILNLVITFAIPGISIGGHLGGLIAGAIVGFLMFDLDEKRQLFGRNRWAAPVLTVGLGVAFAVATVVIARAQFPEFAQWPLA